ncbi:MAG: AsmA family protein [Crocinitomicaceae bacterium]|nr:AsmA family protein [Crocinitomicaceae bacterium]
MEKKEKKKKSLFRRILKWSGITLLLLIAALIIIPIVFKDEIKERVIKEVNKSLNAKLTMGEFDLTFISTFPNMTVELNDTKLQGINEFKDVELMNIKQFVAHVGFWSVVSGDQVEIDEIHLIEPTFDVRVLNNGLANYDIVKPDSVKTPEEVAEPSNFKLSLKEYSITKGNVKYKDEPSAMSMDITNLTHLGTGDLTADVIDFETTTNMDQITFDMDGVSYLTDVKTDVVMNILMEFTEKSSKFTLKENQFKLNALDFSVDGFYEMLEGYDNMDLKLNASKASFKDFLSLIPAFYHTGYESMVSKGNLEMGGFVKGKMDDKNMPGWDFHLGIDKASIRYPDLPGSITNIAVKAGSKFAGGEDMDKMTIDVDKFHALFGGNSIDANLKMRNPMTDPLLVSNIMAKMDLATLKNFVPMAEGESYNGKLDADVHLDGRMSALEREDYEAFKAEGMLTLKNMLYKSKDLSNDVAIDEMIFRFSPKNLALEKLIAKTGKSDFQMNGTIDNYMGYIFRDELLKGNFNFMSKNIDLDELMNLSPSSAATEPAATTATETTSEPLLIPNNVDFALNTLIGNLHYNGFDIKNVSGDVKMKEEVAKLEGVTMNAMGGTIGLRGSYDTRDHAKPTIDFAYSLKDIDIQQLAKNFVTIDKLAPIAKYTQGRISSTMEMKSDLTAAFEPIYSSLTGLGDLSTSTVTISGFKPFEKMGEVLNISKLSKQTIKDVKAKFQFADGKVNVKPFDINLGKIKTTVSGFTSFDQAIDYDLKMMIPKEEIPAAMIKSVEQAISKLNSLAPKLNVQTLPDAIPVKLDVLGTVMDPKITSNFKEALLEASGNLKDDLINNVKETVKDTVKAIINDKVDEAKAELEKRKQQLLEDAQKQADKLKAEAKKAANSVRSEAAKQAKALMDQAGSNPIKQAAAKKAGEKLIKEAEEKAVKIEKEGDSKADAIMREAREKADKLK